MPEAPAAPTPEAPAAPATPAAEMEGTADVDFQARAAAVLAQANGEETPATPAAPKTPEIPAAGAPATPEDPWPAKFAQLNDGQKRLRADQEAWKATQREEKLALQREAQELEVLRQAKSAGSAVKALQALGMSYEDATKEVLGQPVGKKEEAPAPKEDPKLSALEQEVRELRAERAQEVRARGIADFRAALVKKAEAGGELYELVRGTETYDDAVDFVIAYHKQNGVLPGETEEAAMENALAHIERREEARLLRPGVLTSNKLRSRLGAVAEAPKPAVPGPQATSAKSPPSSLTNSLASAAPTRTAKPEPQSVEDYRAAAAALLAGDAG